MKLQRSTWILLSLALLLGVGVYFYEKQVAPQKEIVKTTKKQIFSFKEDQIQSLTIYINKKPLQVVKLERVSGGKTQWQMKYPQDVPASDAAVSFLLNLLVEGKSDRTINNVSAEQLKEYGLDEPEYKVKIELKNKEVHRIILGKLDFNRSFLYAQVDPYVQNNQKSEVLLIPVDFEYAVNRPLAEWQPSKSEQPQTPNSANTPTPNNSPNTEITPSPDVKKPPQEKQQPSPTSTTPSQKLQPSPTSTTPSQKAQPSPTSTTPSQKPQPSPISTTPSQKPQPSPISTTPSQKLQPSP
jgi:hypothetical protein